MEYFFYTVIIAIMGLVIYLAMKAIGTGLEARSELKRDGTLDKNREDPYTFKSVEDDENDDDDGKEEDVSSATTTL